MSSQLVSDAEIAVIVPLFNKFAYGRRACLSALKYTQRSILLIVLDDASPYYPRQDWDAWRKGLPEDRLFFKHFGVNAGLTRSWNYGLEKARELGVKYAICGNSDILFTPHWEEGLLHQLERNDMSLVAPLTNAPGPTNGGRQRVDNYFPGYSHKRDDADYLNKVAQYCHQTYRPEQVVECDVNGFFMMAAVARWWEGSFNDTYVFDPSKKMTGNEDELQKRWRRKKFRTGFVPSSFVYHYRAVSRGDKFKHTGWHRIDDINKPV